MAGIQTLFTFLTFCIVFSQSQRTGYVVVDVKLECVPLNSDICPKFNILKEVAHDLQAIPESINKTLAIYLRTGHLNQSCVEATMKVSCLAIPHCDPYRQYVDTEEVVKECKKANLLCPGDINDNLLNCTRLEELGKQATRDVSLKCEKVVDKTGTCPDLKYKFPKIDGVDYQQVFKNLKEGLTEMKSQVPADCFKTLRPTGCLVAQRVCSDDEKQILALLTKQECNKRFECLPDKIRNGPMKETCDSFPDAKNATKVEIDGSTGNRLTQTLTYAFISFFIASRFI